MIAPTSWTERKFEFNFPVGVFPIIVERLRGTPIRLEIMFRNSTDKTVKQKAGDKWPVIEQVNHLCNCEEIWLGRVEDIINHPRLQRPIRLMDSLFSTAEHDDHHLAKIRGLVL